MSQKPVTIPKKPVLKPVEDFYFLRREGIGYIEQMGSKEWTDYNPHDPGITILEALCYALTDLGYRIGWDIKDLLAPADPAQQTDQAFYTARDILTVNPWTPDDFRRLLIDLDGVRNGWVFCKECACDLKIYAWCDKEKELAGNEEPLVFSYQKPADGEKFSTMEPQGLYEILLELESDPELGDLNDRKLEQSFTVFDSDLHPHTATLELRFPAWELLEREQYRAFVNSSGNLTNIMMTGFSRSKAPGGGIIGELETQNNLKGIFYVRLEVEFQPGEVINIDNATLRIFGNDVVKENLIVKTNTPVTFQISPFKLESILAKNDATGFVHKYRRKLQEVEAFIKDARFALHEHRNLDEDYCHLSKVSVEDVTVCADIEVTPGADIERVQAQVWFEIERYFNPPVHFYPLPELMEQGIPVEEIFNGPALENGFIKADELSAAGLKTVLRCSDIINLLMDIEGVVAVNNLMLTKYDAEGNPVTGAADGDPNRLSARWVLTLSDRHQPRLYRKMSRFLFYKNGLPFLPRMDEANATLVQLQGEAERPKIKNAPRDLPVPAGTFRQTNDYFPVQYSFPVTYGIGFEGLPSHASTLRRAQARQLKAFLMSFEQLLANALEQITHSAALFSLNPTVDRTYFTRWLDEQLITGANDIFNGLTQARLDALAETAAEFLERRNRFLDHLMARFGEQFGEYTLLLNNLKGEKVALKRLISNKIAFLKACPVISRDRARAFDYTVRIPCPPGNKPGLKRRVGLLLGFPDLAWTCTVIGPAFSWYNVAYELRDENGRIWWSGDIVVSSTDTGRVPHQAFDLLLTRMILPEAYNIVPNGSNKQLTLRDDGGFVIGISPLLFATNGEANDLKSELLGWSANERSILVEHLLLRPKFSGDALFPPCTDGGCQLCDDIDPYSFRLSFVMPGWSEPFGINLGMRGFAERTIRQETPSHLIPKICWIGNDGYVPDPCDPVLGALGDVLETAAGHSMDCSCAETLFNLYRDVFLDWFADKKMVHWNAALWRAKLTTLFAGILQDGITCMPASVIPPAAHTLLLDYFTDIALNGWQFEKFEEAWCNWLEENAKWDWPELRLQDRVEAVLTLGLLPGYPAPKPGDICQCATGILAAYGMTFYNWMKTKLDAGTVLQDIAPGTLPKPAPAACGNLKFNPNTMSDIQKLLWNQYKAFIPVSYYLWIVVDRLSQLRNTYAVATLHDCDDGSDVNPVRLNSTALGNY